MLSIATFFDKFKNAAVREMAVRQSILDAIGKNIGTSAADLGLAAKDVELHNKIVRIRAGSALKNQIFMKKDSILREIRQANPQHVITDLQ